MEGSAAGGLSGAGSGGGSGWGSGAGEEAEGDEDENMVYYFLEESTGYMEPALRCLSLLHTPTPAFPGPSSHPPVPMAETLVH